MKSSNHQIANYFVVVGLPDHPQHFQALSNNPTKRRPTANVDPITDVTVIFKALGDPVPDGYECIETTPTGLPANLNFGSFLTPEVYLCLKRGRDRPALTDMGVMVEGAVLLENAGAVFQTPTGRIANINNASSPCLYVTYSRSPPNAATLDNLVVMDICVINASKGEEPPHTFYRIDQKLNTGILGADMHLCYRTAKLRDHVLSFKPEVLSRYPRDDTAAPYPLNAHIPMFCMPSGASLVVLPAEATDPRPVFSSFTQINEASRSLDENFVKYDYGYVLTFYETCTIEQLGSLQINGLGLSLDVPLKDQGKRIIASKAICLLSQYAFISEFKQYLTYIYKMSFTENHKLPIERFIGHLLHEVPVPSTEQPRILVHLPPEVSILFTRPEEISSLPPSCASFTDLLYDLGVEKTLDVFLYALLGHSMLVNSFRPLVLISACEAIKAMIFPIIWSFPFIPCCPLAFSDIVQLPISFIIGIDSRYFDSHEPPPEVIRIDLDTRNILMPKDNKNLTAAKLLPKEPAAQLRSRLEKVYKKLQHPDFSDEVIEVSNDALQELLEMKRQRETTLELECREAFLHFMATILHGYRAFLIVPINVKTKQTMVNVESLFRIKDFVRTRNKSLARFFEVLNLGDSQNFAKFVEELTSSSRPEALDFFNDCCHKVEQDMMKNTTSARTRLVECSRDFANDRTAVIPPPSALGIEEGKLYSYNNFPLLDASLFLPRTIAKSATSGKIGSGSSTGSGRHHFDWNIVRRTAQEVSSCTALLDRRSSVPFEWAKTVEAQCYAVWFSVLPALCGLVPSRRKLLTYAVSVARSWDRFSESLGNDQTPFRVIFALSNVYRYPANAIQLFMHIHKKKNFELNTATLALCSKVLYQSRPACKWRRLRAVVCAIARFRAAGVRHRSRSQQSKQLFSSCASNKSSSKSKQTIGFKLRSAIAQINRQSSNFSLSNSSDEVDGQSCDAEAPCSHNRSNQAHRQPARSIHSSRTKAARRDDMDDLDFWPLPAKTDECSVQIVLCAANKCPSPKCGHILLEEDIMAMGSASDSEFNVACTMCGHRFIPKLEVYLKDFRSCDEPKTGRQNESWDRLRRCQSEIMAKWSGFELARNADADGTEKLVKRAFRLVGPISCIFLSSLALRKEIEQHITSHMNINSTSTLFADSSFVDNNETLYWNLLFFFARMKLPSHLPSLAMFSRLLTGNSSSNTSVTASELREAASHVNVLVVWDNLALYPMSDRPLYWHWAVNFGKKYPVANALVDYRPFSRRLMSKLLTSIRQSDMLHAMKLVLLIRRRGLPNELFLRNYSMYRILLNLCIVALGRNNINLKAFDRAYFTIFTQIKLTAAKSGAALRARGMQPLSNELRPFDQPPSEAAMYCRRAYFYADIYHDFEQRSNFAVHSFSNKSSMAAVDTPLITNEHIRQVSIDESATATATEEVVDDIAVMVTTTTTATTNNGV